jgi:hypothetical protein
MSNYFMLECYGPDEEPRASIDTVENADHLNWMLASRFKGPVPAPINVILNAKAGMMLPMFNRGILLFSDALLAALNDSGVDNLDCYPAELFNPATNERFFNYKAVNIIGAVAAANLGESQCTVHGTPRFDVDFDSLALDPQKAKNILMFRLAECVSGIVVHESVRRAVEQKGIPNLDWIAPGEWIG